LYLFLHLYLAERLPWICKTLYSSRKYRIISLFIWGIFVLSCLIYYYFNLEKFSAKSIADSIKEFSSDLLFIYLIVSVLRGFTLIPSTPFVIAGSMIFPAYPHWVLMISMFGIACSCSMVYLFSNVLSTGSSDRKIKLQEKLKKKLDSPLGFFFVFVWSFFPFAPTDIVCLAAGSIKMNFIKFITAVLLGELIICSCYVYFGKSLLELI